MPNRQYFECHITIDPSTVVGVDSFRALTQLVHHYGFRVSDFLLLNPDAPTAKVFISCRDDTLNIRCRMEEMVAVLAQIGYRVLRKKLEFAFFDERME